jgi:hypothetical protein
MKIRLFVTMLLITLAGSAGVHQIAPAPHIILADKGQAKLPIIVSPNADVITLAAAQSLAEILNKITDAKFEISTKFDHSGIIVGTINDFTNLKFTVKFNSLDLNEQQGYEIKSFENGLYIIGATPEAVKYGISGFLYQLGCRFYFPMEKWQKIPKLSKLEFASYIREVPDFTTRMIWPGGSYKPIWRSSSERWMQLNRIPGYSLITSHSYGEIILNNKKEFEQHPEYYSLINGKRYLNIHDSKFCVSNKGLQKLVVDYELSKLRKNQQIKSISLDPNDGGHWCECASCAAIGTPSTRAVYLANLVARAIAEEFPDKRIGMYAYNEHSPAPDIDVEQNIVISVATSFIIGGNTFDTLLASWKKRKAHIVGVRDYLDVLTWSWNQPGQMNAGNSEYLAKTLPGYYTQNARYYVGESTDAWGPCGLGLFLTTRILWDVTESKKVELQIKDFLTDNFGKSANTMKEFYTLIDGANKRKVSSDLLARLYKIIAHARVESADDEAVMSRLDDLALYVSYVEKCDAYLSSSDKDKQTNFDNLIHFVAKIADSRMVDSYYYYRIFVLQSSKIRVSNNNPIDWKKSTAFARSEIDSMITKGIADNKMLDFEPIAYSDNLIPAPALANQGKIKGNFPGQRFKRIFYTWVENRTEPLEFSVRGGQIVIYRNKGNVSFKLFNIGGSSQDGTRETLEDINQSVKPDGNTYTIKLQPKQTGLYRIDIDDKGALTTVNLKKGKFAILTDISLNSAITGNYYFYVPKGSKIIGFYHKLNRGTLMQSDGKVVYDFSKNPIGRYLSIVVSEGQDGKLWCLSNVSGSISLLNVPPYLSLSGEEMLLPKEVVEKDNLGE